MLQRISTSFLAAVLLGSSTGAGIAHAAESEWLSLCGQCVNPSVTSKSGVGTDHAVAEGKVTRQDALDWCKNWRPDGKPDPCVKEQLTAAGNKVYRATANSSAGRLTAIDGKSYALAGAWTSDVGRGRSSWRDPATGAIVAQDEESGGLALSQ